MKAKLEKIEEIKESTLLMTEHGIVEVEPQKTLPGQYPEVPEMELPDSLKKRPWERDWNDID